MISDINGSPKDEQSVIESELDSDSTGTRRVMRGLSTSSAFIDRLEPTAPLSFRVKIFQECHNKVISLSLSPAPPSHGAFKSTTKPKYSKA
ncbi:uncharacterized protein PITG_08731 [Phytophthora infestans T30-4]|uniref:Uncharacterized protein n=1 Tax=Phytophthora infestans (strain T30-4) TaxID=403677 RepID=D0ND25_PHYIT|nr:uncharacterized protein PITG_08731 [Phytophthora infestans T30-4]EEY55982.1 hypothetical protein PITG_08731 [Phytophthora infestans T30-4]|eukprot:XP_002902812.1 hypothetical protein PITG_08731 [Phytophthora infestans T30-4]